MNKQVHELLSGCTTTKLHDSEDMYEFMYGATIGELSSLTINEFDLVRDWYLNYIN